MLPTFASTLFTFGIMPKHQIEGTDINTSSYNEMPIGTGPFKVKEFKRGQYCATERFDDYWRKAPNGDKLPYLDGIVFKMIKDSNTLITQLKSGEVDLVVQTPYNQPSRLKGLRQSRSSRGSFFRGSTWISTSSASLWPTLRCARRSPMASIARS